MVQKFFYVCAALFLLAGAYAVGARNAGAGAPASQEIAVLSGVALDGEAIPLPAYQDGSVAVESECRWTVSGRKTVLGGRSITHCFTEGRTVRVFDDTPFQDNEANYLIIAVRNLTPTANRSETIGGIKAQYR